MSSPLSIRAPPPATIPASAPTAHGGKSLFAPNPFTLALLAWQAAMVLLFSLCAAFPAENLPGGVATTTAHPARYGMFQDTHVMMAVGFGFLYTLLRRYAWSGVAYNFLLCACVSQWALLCTGFWENVRRNVSGAAPAGAFPAIPLSLEALVGSDYTVATVLISFGALLGRLSPTQALWMAFAETIFATGNNSLALYLRVSDAGGSMVIHCFGAAFGLAFAAALGDAASRAPRVGNGEDALGTSRHNGTFAIIGTLFLFCFWPCVCLCPAQRRFDQALCARGRAARARNLSHRARRPPSPPPPDRSFNAALLDEPSAGRAVVNTVLAIAGSVAVSFALSRAIHGGRFFDMEHVQNATLAGGVAIGAACDMILNPGAALATGVAAGAVSTYGFAFLSPALKRRGLTDTCGIADLHLIPGIVGGVASAIAAAGVGGAAWPAAAVAAAFPLRGDRAAATQGGFQAAVTLLSLSIGAASGALAGALLRRAPWAEPQVDGFCERRAERGTSLRGGRAAH